MSDIKCQVAGIVAAIEVQSGADIEAEQVIMFVESMKMEIPVEAPVSGVLAEILVEEGDSVVEDQVVARLSGGKSGGAG